MYNNSNFLRENSIIFTFQISGFFEMESGPISILVILIDYVDYRDYLTL